MCSGILAVSVLLLSTVSCAAVATSGAKLETFIVYGGDRESEESDEYDSEESDGDFSQTGKILPSDRVPDPWTTTSPLPKGAYKKWCKDAAPEGTGFEVHTNEGFLGFASCLDLVSKCHNWVNSTTVKEVCPVTCFICDPQAMQHQDEPPCYDSVSTGVRFKNGPKATCKDLTLYCNHSTLYYHVQAACRLSCGLCDAHVGLNAGDCADAEAHHQPEFMVSGKVASCADLADFCGSGFANSYLIRHKCPKTCGACPDLTTTPTPWGLAGRLPTGAAGGATTNTGEMSADCDRRRRWGFCETRRRRNE